MTPAEAATEIETALRNANAWPEMRVEQDIVRAQIVDTARRLVASLTPAKKPADRRTLEQLRNERGTLLGKVERLEREVADLDARLAVAQRDRAAHDLDAAQRDDTERAIIDIAADILRGGEPRA